MAVERLAPDALLEQTNLTGAVTDVDDDPDTPDAAWLTADSNNSDSAARVSFPTPSGALSEGVGLQEFRVRVRKMGGTGTPTARIELWEAGVLVSTVLADTGVTSTSGVVLAGTWDATGRTAASIECRVYGTKTGGSPSVRATIEVGAIEWNATVAATETSLDAQPGSFAFTGIAASLLEDTVLNAQPGSFVFTGIAASLLEDMVLNAQPGSFMFTGIAASLLEDTVLNAQPGVFSWTGVAATLEKSGGATDLDAQPGAFSWTGIAAALLEDHVLVAQVGAFSWNGVAATFEEIEIIDFPADATTFAITGFAATLEKVGLGGGLPPLPSGGVVFVPAIWVGVGVGI